MDRVKRDDDLKQAVKSFSPLERLTLKNVFPRWKDAVNESWGNCTELSFMRNKYDENDEHMEEEFAVINEAKLQEINLEEFQKILCESGSFVRIISFLNFVDLDDIQMSIIDGSVAWDYQMVNIKYHELLTTLESECRNVEELYIAEPKDEDDDENEDTDSEVEDEEDKEDEEDEKLCTEVATWIDCNEHLKKLTIHHYLISSLKRLPASLVSMNLQDMPDLDFQTLPNLLELAISEDFEGLEKIAALKSYLKMLDIANFEITFVLAAKVLPEMINLEYLRISMHKDEDHDAILYLISRCCTKIKELRIEGADNKISDEGLVKVMHNLPALEILYLRGSNVKAITLLKNLKKLELGAA